MKMSTCLRCCKEARRDRIVYANNFTIEVCYRCSQTLQAREAVGYTIHGGIKSVTADFNRSLTKDDLDFILDSSELT